MFPTKKFIVWSQNQIFSKTEMKIFFILIAEVMLGMSILLVWIILAHQPWNILTGFVYGGCLSCFFWMSLLMHTNFVLTPKPMIVSKKGKLYCYGQAFLRVMFCAGLLAIPFIFHQYFNIFALMSAIIILKLTEIGCVIGFNWNNLFLNNTAPAKKF